MTGAPCPKEARVLNRAQMRRAEAAADRAGTSYEQLMENAGAAAAEQLKTLALPRKALLLLCGKGNNGGDALVIARLLHSAGWAVQAALVCGEDLSALARLNLGRLPPGVALTHGPPPALTAPLIVDGVFGIGFRGDLPPDIRALFQSVNAQNATRVALDLPSGLDCDTGQADPHTFKAHLTLTFGAGKPGLGTGAGPALCGEVRVLDIGL